MVNSHGRFGDRLALVNKQLLGFGYLVEGRLVIH
jgi:hypothetical protein